MCIDCCDSPEERKLYLKMMCSPPKLRGKEKSVSLMLLLSELEGVGVKRGSRNRTVAERTGYSEGTVKRILSGTAKLTKRFICAVHNAFRIGIFR